LANGAQIYVLDSFGAADLISPLKRRLRRDGKFRQKILRMEAREVQRDVGPEMFLSSAPDREFCSES
jgi:hypothetical protein